MKNHERSILIALSALVLVSCGGNSVGSVENSMLSCGISETSSEVSESSSSADPNFFRVEFQNYDGTSLYVTEVEEHHEAVYNGETPTKEAEDQADYTYEFSGWDRDLTDIESDVVTIAQFKRVSQDSWGDIGWC